MVAITEEFQAATISIYGTTPAGTHELIRFPLLFEIDWLGSKAGVLSEHDPQANRRGRLALRQGPEW